MTRIMTITSGMAQVGKTHLAVNIALELVRRGRFAGIFHDVVPGADVAALLELQDLPDPQQYEAQQHGVIRQGYQGVDVVACEQSLGACLCGNDPLHLQCLGAIDVRDGYDDFLLDTSGMDAGLQLACCHAAASVILVITPQADSQAEAFALLRVLSVNDFSGQLYLLVNKSEYTVDSKDIYDDFSRLVKHHLGFELVYLGDMPEDRLIPLAEQNRQAFSSLFPESAATAGIVAAVDVLDDASLAAAATQTLAAFLDKLLAVAQAPVYLPGGVQLDTEQAVTIDPAEQPAPLADREQGGVLSLLQYAGDVPGLWDFLELLPQALQSLGAELNELVIHHGEHADAVTRRYSVLSRLAELLSLLGDVVPAVPIELDVSDTFVTGQQPCWLQGGRYLKYVLQLPAGPLPATVRTWLVNMPGLLKSTSADGEEIYELLEARYNRCLNVASSARTGARIQVWLPVDGHDVLTGLPERQAAVIPGKDLH